MEFIIKAEMLQKAIKVLGMVARVNSQDNAGRIGIEIIDENAIFTCNNGITAVSFTASDVKTEGKGFIVIEYSKMKSFIASYKVWDGESGVDVFEFITVDRTTKIMVNNKHSDGKIAKGSLKLTNFNTALMSKIPGFEIPDFTLNSTIFRAATSKILYAINPQVDHSQQSLQGMCLQFRENYIYFVGSNGIVLSEYQVPNTTNIFDEDVILQYDFIMGLRRLIVDDIPLLWDIKGNRVSVKFDEIIYIGRKIVGHEFPEYKGALDKYTDTINVSKEFLMGALYPFSDTLDIEDNNRLTIEINNKILKVFNQQAIIEVELDIVGGLDFSIDLNGKLLIQTIDAIKDDYITFKFSNSDGFAIFDSTTHNNQKALITSIKKR